MVRERIMVRPYWGFGALAYFGSTSPKWTPDPAATCTPRPCDNGTMAPMGRRVLTHWSGRSLDNYRRGDAG